MATVFVTLCDKSYIEKAKQTIYELRCVGQWSGDVVLITVDCHVQPFDNVEIYEVSHISTDKLLESYVKFPFHGGDGRHLNRLYQWDKLYVFSDFFTRWSTVIFLDAGMRVLGPVHPIVDLDCSGSLLAPDDSQYPENPEVRFHRLIDPSNEVAYRALLDEFGEDVLQKRCFLNGLFMYDTALLNTITFDELVETMNRYPIARCNEMTLMNIVFSCRHNVWKSFPKSIDNRYVFGYNESYQNGTPGHWLDFYFMKYPFYTPNRIHNDKDTAFVTLCDASYFEKAKKTIYELRERGGWAGDVVLMAIDFQPPPIPHVTTLLLPHVDTTSLVQSLRKHPIRPMDDNRHFQKLYQWDKLQVFRPYFKHWKRIVFLDAGMRVFDSVYPLLQLSWKNSFLAPDDSDPYDNGRRFDVQLDLTANPDATERLFQTFPKSILKMPYFLNCMFVFDTALLERVSFEEMVYAMNEYPICMCNEMGIMNLFLTCKLKVWRPFPQKVGTKYLFGWNEANYRENPSSESFHFLKYSITG